jgi:hypothetical protein
MVTVPNARSLRQMVRRPLFGAGLFNVLAVAEQLRGR